MKILITGSTGFLGGTFGRFAVARGHRVLGISRSNQAYADWPGEYHQADVGYEDVSRQIRLFAPDLLLHAAGSASVGESIVDPYRDFRATVATFANVLEGIRCSGIRPLIIFPSSAAVYGNPPLLPVREDAPSKPISPYGFHKVACEVLAGEYAECFALGILICRLFSVFGTHQKRLLVWEIYSQLSSNRDSVYLQGSGNETRDFVHIADVCNAFLQAATVVPREVRTIINIGTGQATSAVEIAQCMRAMIAPRKKIVCGGIARPGDPDHWRADIGLLKHRIPQWKPTALARALQVTIDEWQQSTQAERLLK